MTKEFVYETLKTYYARNFKEFENLSKDKQKSQVDRYWGGFCEVAMFAQHLGLTYEEVTKVYDPYYKKFREIKVGD